MTLLPFPEHDYTGPREDYWNAESLRAYGEACTKAAIPTGFVLVRAYSTCGRFANDNPAIRSYCQRKFEAGCPCDKCPERMKRN